MSRSARWRLSWGGLGAALVASAGLLALVVRTLGVGSWAAARELMVGGGAELPFVWAGREFFLTEPRALFLLPVLPWLVLATLLSLSGLSLTQRLLSFALRAAFLACLIVGVARPKEEYREKRICAVALVDVSESIRDEGLNRARAGILQLMKEQGEEDDLRVIAFGESFAEVQLAPKDAPPGMARGAARSEVASGTDVVPSLKQLRGAASGQATDVARALRGATAFSSADCVRRYVIFSDGIETRQAAAEEIAALRADGARVSTVSVSDGPPQDVAVLLVETPEGVRLGEPFEVRVTLRATSDSEGTLTLLQNGEENGLGGKRHLKLAAGEHTEVFQSVARVQGEATYQAQFAPDAGHVDALLDNNRVLSRIDVPGPPRVLLVDSEPGEAGHLARALSTQQFDVDVRSPLSFPRSKAELSEFRFVIVSDVAHKELGRGAESLLTFYVKAGGGLLFSGGSRGYGPGGYQGTELEKILPVRMDSEKERQIPGVAMVLVIDRSGSMTGLPLEMAKEACAATAGVLSPSDLLQVVAFDSAPTRYVRMQQARYRAEMVSSIMRIQPGGGTEIFASLDMAYQDLAATEARKKHIILLTDGNAGSDGIYELATAAFSEGITISTVALGSGANQELLRMISDSGGGRFIVAPDPESLPRIFTRETEMLAKDAAVEDWFPIHVNAQPEFLSGISLGALPYLRGLTRTQPKGAPAEAILLSDTGQPVLSRMRVGLGWTLAWTSDLKAHWGVDFLRWNQFGKFMAQLVRAHQFVDDTEIIPMQVSQEGRTVVATVDAFDRDERFDSSLSSSLRADLSSGGEGSSQSAEFRRVAPGRYEARIELASFGAYSLRAVHQRKTPSGELVSAGISRGAASLPYPEEYRSLVPDTARLARWAADGGGRVISEAQFSGPEVAGGKAGPGVATGVFQAGEDGVTSRKESQNSLLFWALGLFFLDLFVRRVRLFDRNFGRAARA